MHDRENSVINFYYISERIFQILLAALILYNPKSILFLFLIIFAYSRHYYFNLCDHLDWNAKGFFFIKESFLTPPFPSVKKYHNWHIFYWLQRHKAGTHHEEWTAESYKEQVHILKQMYSDTTLVALTQQKFILKSVLDTKEMQE